MVEVGPVLQADARGRAVAKVIAATNPGIRIIDRGSYLGIVAQRECVFSKEVFEKMMNEGFRLPGDLEAVMPSFMGRLEISETRARWSAR